MAFAEVNGVHSTEFTPYLIGQVVRVTVYEDDKVIGQSTGTLNSYTLIEDRVAWQLRHSQVPGFITPSTGHSLKIEVYEFL